MSTLPHTEFLLYTGSDGQTNVTVLVEDETVWITQEAMQQLFGRVKSTIREHISNVFSERELDRDSVVRNFRTTAHDGKEYETNYYNLDVIISVGYRVKSAEGTRFRIWATRTLREFIVKGFVLDDKRLKQGSQTFGHDYFEELLERIREIRTSERRFYQKITDIYALSADYDANDESTRGFFASVQNKLHWAITGKTAAETIYAEVDAAKLNIGLRTWKHAPKGKILKSDVTVAKNYLDEEHISQLNRIVSAYLDLAENRAQRGIVMRMTDWVTFLEGFLQLSSYPILADQGKVSALEAKLKAEGEYEKFRAIQDRAYESDFDKEVKRLSGGKSLAKSEADPPPRTKKKS
jgi:hypothetical protein